MHVPGRTVKPSIGTIDENDETMKAHNSILVEIIQTAAVYCRLLGKHKQTNFLETLAHAATASPKRKDNAAALKD